MSDSIEKLRAAEARLIIAAPQPRQMTPDEREWRIEREIGCIRAALAASRSDAAETWKLRALEAEAKLAALVEAAPEGWKPPDIEGELHRLLDREERLL